MPLGPRTVSTQYQDTDVVLIGGGIMSATFGYLLSRLQPDWTFLTFERLPRVARESTDPWNNAGTGHAGLCELNYTAEAADGSIDATKAFNINEQFQISRQFWANLVAEGELSDPNRFINATPHMTFVHGDKNVDFLRRRHQALVDHPLFASMEFSTDPDVIAGWAPLLIEGRDPAVPIAATFDPTGTDVNFGNLAKQFFGRLENHGGQVETNHEVVDLKKTFDGWLVKVHDVTSDTYKIVKTKFVFVGAGGYALKLLQKAGLDEVRGYGLFPVSGMFLNTTADEVVSRHKAKVYGKAAVGAPPMSVPHLDARVIDGTHAVLFGPFAGWSPRFLKGGSILDLPASLRPHNLKKMIDVGLDNFDLEKYLVGELFRTSKGQMDELRVFAPNVEPSDWEIKHAGQRAQIIKPGANGKGSLQFGTEAIVNSDRTMASVLGASPGASISVDLVLDLLKRSFPDRIAGWEDELRTLIPSYGTKLAADPANARKVMTENAAILRIAPPS